MNQQNQKIVERLREHAEDRCAFPVSEPIGSAKSNDVYHHTQRADDYGRKHFFRTDIKFGENDHIERAQIGTSRHGGQNECRHTVDDIAVNLIFETLDGFGDRKDRLYSERSGQSPPFMQTHGLAGLLKENEQFHENEDTKQ